MKELVHDHIQQQKEAGKSYSARFFSKNGFWKCIGCTISTVTYGKKGYKIWVSHTSKELGNEAGEIDRDIHWKKYLLKLSCHI